MRRGCACVSGLIVIALAVLAEGASASPPTLTVGDRDKVQIVRFDDARDMRTATFSIGVQRAASQTGAPPIPAASVSGDLLSEQNRRLPRDQVKVVSIRWDSVNAFTVKISITATHRIKPGRYTGTVTFGGNGYGDNTVPVTVTATLRSGKGWSLVVMLLGWIAGMVVKALTDLFKANGEKVRSLKSIERYFIRSGFVATAALGAVGAFAAWGFTYLADDVWGAGDLDDLRLAGTALAGVVTGTTVADFFGPFKGRGDTSAPLVEPEPL